MRQVSIFLGGATTNSAVAVRMAHFVVVTETEKAYQLSSGKRKLWLPKRALVPRKGTDASYTLARWFKPNAYQESVLNAVARVNAVSVG